jgi:hypothetical protein
VLLAAAPAVFWGGGVIEEETVAFLRHYWDERPVAERILELRGYDFYQGRELSYAIDFLDAQWVRLLLSHDILFFISLSVLLSSLATVAIGHWLVPAALPRLDRSTRWLILLVYLSNFAVVSTTGLLYRATKPLVAPLLLALLLLLLAEHRQPRLGPWTAFSAVFVTGLAMSLLDRQGLFYLLLVIAALGATWLRTGRSPACLLGAGAAAAAWAAYNYALGPRLIHAVNGYWPNMRFQRLRPAWLLDPRPWLDATLLLGDWARVLFGGLPPGLLLAGAVAAGAIWAWRERGRARRLLLASGAVLVVLAVHLAMVAVMVLRHEPVKWIDHRFWYYPLPFQAFVVFVLLWALERVTAARHRPLLGVVRVVLAGLAVANVAHWPAHRAVMESGPWFSTVARRSALLVRSFRTGRAERLLDGDYRRFYFECLDSFPRLAAHAGARVAEGEGFDAAEIHENGLIAWADQQAQLVVTVVNAGRYVVSGRALLRSGETLSILIGAKSPRPLAEIRRMGGGEGPEPFQAAAELPAGHSTFVLLSDLPEVSREDRRSPRAFALLLPVSVRPESGTHP